MERLRRYLEANQIAQATMAKALGVSQPTVSDWVSGKTTPTAQNLVRISRWTGLSVDELLSEVAA